MLVPDLSGRLDGLEGRRGGGIVVIMLCEITEAPVVKGLSVRIVSNN